MQFSAVLLFAGAAMATYTTYETVVETVTHSKGYGYKPAHTASAVPVPYYNSTPPHSVAHSSGYAPGPAVVTVTVNGCPASSPAPKKTLSSVVVPYGTAVTPAGTGKPSASVPHSPAFTGAASAISGSLAMVGFVGLAAIVLA